MNDVDRVRHVLASHLATAVTPCITCSFQAGGVVLLHMHVAATRPDRCSLNQSDMSFFEALERRQHGGTDRARS